MSDTYTYTPVQELASSEQPHNARALIGANQTIERLTPLGQKTADGTVVVWDPAATDGSQKAVYLGAFDATIGGTAEYKKVIKSGDWNTDAIKWPDGTAATQKALAFVGTPISHQPI
ncbi:head decoration protein [Marinomonas gallaica]|uniref:head decoration protein n=1 Tax=Marinomonas gallaica TaxID=1806667 RepID=UPI003CE49E10